MDKLKDILIKEFNVNHLTIELLEAFEEADKEAAKDFLIKLFKRDLFDFNETDYSYTEDIPF